MNLTDQRFSNDFIEAKQKLINSLKLALLEAKFGNNPSNFTIFRMSSFLFFFIFSFARFHGFFKSSTQERKSYNKEMLVVTFADFWG